jgi:hypothetical protein
MQMRDLPPNTAQAPKRSIQSLVYFLLVGTLIYFLKYKHRAAYFSATPGFSFFLRVKGTRTGYLRTSLTPKPPVDHTVIRLIFSFRYKTLLLNIALYLPSVSVFEVVLLQSPHKVVLSVFTNYCPYTYRPDGLLSRNSNSTLLLSFSNSLSRLHSPLK